MRSLNKTLDIGLQSYTMNSGWQITSMVTNSYNYLRKPPWIHTVMMYAHEVSTKFHTMQQITITGTAKLTAIVQ